MRELPGFGRLSDRYDGSASKALLKAPAIAAMLALGVHGGRLVQAFIVAAEERDRGAGEHWDLLGEHLVSLLTMGMLQQYLMTLAATALGAAFLLAPAVWLCLDRRWPVESLRLVAGVLGLLPVVAITARVLWAGVSGPPITGLTTIFVALLKGLIPLATVAVFLRELRPRQFFALEDLRLDEADADRMPFLAQASRPRERNVPENAGEVRK